MYIVNILTELGLSQEQIYNLLETIYWIATLIFYIICLNTILNLFLGNHKEKIQYFFGIEDRFKLTLSQLVIYFFILFVIGGIFVSSQKVMYVINNKDLVKQGYSSNLPTHILTDTSKGYFYDHKNKEKEINYIGLVKDLDEYYFEIDNTIYRTTDISFKKTNKDFILFKEFNGKKDKGFKDINYLVFESITVSKDKENQLTYKRDNIPYIEEYYQKVKFNKK